MLTQRGSLGCLVTVLVIAAVLGGCLIKETGEALVMPTPSLILLPKETGDALAVPTPSLLLLPLVQWADQPTTQSSVQPAPLINIFLSLSINPLWPSGVK